MKDADRKRIAALFPGRWERNYVASKLRTDPLYAALADIIGKSDQPLLDLGCGLGLVALYLRSEGITVPIHGLDYDHRKIEMAKQAAAPSGDPDLSFAVADLRKGLPEHSGNVCILDILQFFKPDEQKSLLESACSKVAAGGKLIIRSGLRDNSTRFKITVLGDLLAKATLWMKAAPTYYPTSESLAEILSPFGKVTLSPLWGRTPFNNHLIVMEKLDGEINPT